MKSINIKLSLAENVKTFVNVVNRYPYDMDLRAGRHVVDAKSILGIFSLDLSRPITLEVYADEYSGESVLRWDGKLYNVERTYEKGEKVELTCSDARQDREAAP